MKPLRSLLFAAVVTAASAAVAAERDDFVLHCAGCHKFDGSGSQVVPALDQVGNVFAVNGGRQYLARVPGVAQAPLNDQRLAALLNWLLGEFGQSEARPPYGAEEVGHLRAQPLRDPVAARQVLFAE
jgi:mono/diheme cytochrome c family protein